MTSTTTTEPAATEPTTTEHGLHVDHRFGLPAGDDAVQRAASALRGLGYTVGVVDTPAEARAHVTQLLPTDKTIFTASSETLRHSGLDADINESGTYNAVRPALTRLREQCRFDEMRAAGAAPDIVVGSMHALTEDGRLLAASGSGSQLALYSYGAGQAIWVIGAQKIVPDLDTAIRRIETYAYPLEDTRFRDLAGAPALLSKILIINREMFPERATVIIVREPIGF